LLDVESGLYFGLNALGTEIWNLLERGGTEEDICARLLDEYEVGPDDVRGDVATFLGALLENGLVKRVEQ
jgi:hypothetical protein